MIPYIALLLLAVSSVAFADDYQPLDWIQVTEDGGVEVSVGFLTLAAEPGDCLTLISRDITVDDIEYSLQSNKWQVLDGDEWVDVPGTESEDSICGIPENAGPGTYRWALEATVDGIALKFASTNTYTIPGDTAIQATSWSYLKMATLKHLPLTDGP